MARFVPGGLTTSTSETSGPYTRGETYSFSSPGTISKFYFYVFQSGIGGPASGDIITVRMRNSSGVDINTATWTADGTAGEKSVNVSWVVSASTNYQFVVDNLSSANEYREPRALSDSAQGTTVNGITRVTSGGIGATFTSGYATANWYTDIEYTAGAATPKNLFFPFISRI